MGTGDTQSSFTCFGAMEVFTNTGYLLKGHGMQLARKQHRELPSGVTDGKIRIKAVCMLVFGAAFLTAAIFSYVYHAYIKIPILTVAVLFSIYGIIEALFYRYGRTFGFALVTIVLAACAVII